MYDDSSLATNPGFLMTGIKPITPPTIQIYNKENVNPNIRINPNVYTHIGGRTKRKYKRRKSRKNKK